MCHFQGLVTTISGSLKPILEVLRPRLGVHRIHDTLERGLQMMLCSLVALHKEGPADIARRDRTADGEKGIVNRKVGLLWFAISLWTGACSKNEAVKSLGARHVFLIICSVFWPLGTLIRFLRRMQIASWREDRCVQTVQELI